MKITNTFTHIRLTTDAGKYIYKPDVELPASTVVLANGLFGTAYQLFASDGLWHSATGMRITQDDLLSLPNVLVIHVPTNALG